MYYKIIFRQLKYRKKLPIQYYLHDVELKFLLRKSITKVSYFLIKLQFSHKTMPLSNYLELNCNKSICLMLDEFNVTAKIFQII